MKEMNKNLKEMFFPFLIFSLLLPVKPLFARKPSTSAVPMINITAGQVAVFDNELQTKRYGLEYRGKPFGKYQLIPAIGFAFSEDSDSFLYTDLRHDFWLSDRWVTTPSLGLGIFTKGNNIDLGENIEFRTGIEIAYRFINNYRLGLAFFHLSNAGIADTNPGTEAIVISLSIPFE